MKIQSAHFPGQKVRKAALVTDIILKEFYDDAQRKDQFVYLNFGELRNVETL